MSNPTDGTPEQVLQVSPREVGQIARAAFVGTALGGSLGERLRLKDSVVVQEAK